LVASFRTDSDVERVRDATDLVALIGEHVALRPKGREHVGICPFHDDHRPSMAVVTHKGNAFFKCHSCGAGGDAFDFVQMYHKMDFPEALRFLADRAGVELTPRSGPAPSDGPGRTELLAASQFGCAFFQRTLADEALGAEAREILERRGVSSEMIEQFMIGLAPDSYEAFLNTLRGKASSIATATAVGLLKARREGGGVYDAFRNRIIFPICDDVGRPIAFGGRVIAADDTPKYLNSAENRLFHKSRTLYALHLAKRSIIDLDRAIVAEGYTDVIACHQHGITNVVGSMGTALTSEQAQVLSRVCTTVVLVFDGDEAGQRAADRAIQVFFQQPVDVRICVLPEGRDPDEMLRAEGGREVFLAALDGAVDALEYKLDRFAQEVSGATGVSARQRHLERFLEELSNLGFASMQGTRKRFVLHRLADLFGMPTHEIERAMPRKSARRSAPPPVMVEEEHPSDAGVQEMLLPDEAMSTPVSRARRLAEHDVLSVLIFEPAAALEAAYGEDEGRALPAVMSVDQFTDMASRATAEGVFGFLRSGETFTMQQLLSRLKGDAARDLASRLYFDGQRVCEGDKRETQDLLRERLAGLLDCIERERYQRQIMSERTAGGAGADDQERVMEKLIQRRRQGVMTSAISQGVRSS
jgi:DNA primase catalytic core